MENIEDIYELTPLQQGMLFHTLLEPESGVYFVQMSLPFSGEFNAHEFRRAWQQVLDRHPILRTSFHWDDIEKPLQVVHRNVELPFHELDWRELPPNVQEERLEAFLKEDQRQGFELSEAPLVRMTLIRLAEDDHELVWSFHHLLLDGWSLPLVLNDFSTFSASEDQHVDLPPPRPFGDYIAWLQQQDLSQAEAFWRRTLKGFTDPVPLPIGRLSQNLPQQEGNHDGHTLWLPAETTAALQAFGHKHRLTTNTILQGAWAILLSHYSSKSDVLFGAVVSGRPPQLAGVESMVGMFINTLPVRVRVSPEDSLLPFLERIQADQFEARQYEYTPLVQVQAWSEVPRGRDLFETLLVWENYPTAAEEQGQEEEKRGARVFERLNYPLAIIAGPGAEWFLSAMYDYKRFDKATIERLLTHFKTLLERFIHDPNQRLSALRLTTDTERQQLLVEWNQTKSDYPRFASIHQLFEQQVNRTPDKIALVFDDEKISYKELNIKANRLAHYLRRLEVSPDVIVGISMERSVEMVVGLLGILKAGGAYLPLDPQYPKQRLSFMLKDAGVQVLLTQQRLVGELPTDDGVQVIRVDSDWESIEGESEQNPESGVTAENLSYVIYTSGSTGQPKGLGAVHRGVVRLVKETNYAELNEQEVFLQVAPLSFDASTFELWGALCNGARLIIAPPHTLSLEELGDVLLRYQVTTLWLTAGLFHQMVESQANKLGQLHQMLAGGDVLSVPHAEKALLALGADARLINGYGPTENTTFTCCHTIRKSSELGTTVLIGRPIANTQVYVLDGQMQPVPVGVLGELYIGGDGLARGYLNRSDLTAAKFVPDPFNQEGGRRLYRTGDVVRYLEDGQLEFVGRMDYQVKVRGYRIELEEVEAVLRQHAAIIEAVVVARADARGIDAGGGGVEKRLVAYVVSQKELRPSVSELHRFMREKLPEHMRPSALVILEELPLTVNGKVDRRALAEPDEMRPELDEAYRAPVTAEEQMLAGIWAEVLGLERVGIHDNFFELGGHSLLATRLVSRARDAFQFEVPLRLIFEALTVAKMAEAILKLKNKGEGSLAPSITRVTREAHRVEISEGGELTYLKP